MNADELEFAISQYLDGNLPAAERAGLEVRLEQDAGVRATLDEYRRLDGALKGAMPLPHVRWEMLARTISAAVEDERDRLASRSYRMPTWVRSFAAPLALAASLLVATGIGFEIYHYTHVAGARLPAQVAVNFTPRLPAVESSMIIIGPQAQKSSTPAEVQVAIGPSDAVKDEPILVQYSNDLVLRPSHVSVASGVIPAHDTEALQFDME